MDFLWRGIFEGDECCCTMDSSMNERPLPWEQNSEGSAGGPASLPPGPNARVVPTYGVSEDHVQLHGEPIHSGIVILDEMKEMTLAIHTNGFSLTRRCSEGISVSHVPVIVRPWSPFTLVEKEEPRAIFTLTVYRGDCDDRFYFFESPGEKGYEERDRWCDEIADVVRSVSCSLFPRHAISVRPLATVDSTSSRLMAGYLLQCLASDNVSLYYCELHAYIGKKARLVIYEDQWCERVLTSVNLTAQTVLSSRSGAYYCSVFGTGDLCFCARTPEEKELWLRAISNVKVKIMFDAPDVDVSTREGVEMLDTFRASVEEMVLRLPLKPQWRTTEPPAAPMLPPVQRTPWPSATRGDVSHNPVPSVEGTPLGSPLPSPSPSRGLRSRPSRLRGDKPVAPGW